MWRYFRNYVKLHPQIHHKFIVQRQRQIRVKLGSNLKEHHGFSNVRVALIPTTGFSRVKLNKFASHMSSYTYAINWRHCDLLIGLAHKWMLLYFMWDIFNRINQIYHRIRRIIHTCDKL